MFDEPTEEELKEIRERIKAQSGLTDEEWEQEQRESEEYMGYAREYIGSSSRVEALYLPNQE